MATLQDENYEQLVERLTTGFGAMLKQVQELACKNTELEQRLARVRAEEVSSSPLLLTLISLAMMLHNSSRSRVTNVVVIDNIPMISEPPLSFCSTWSPCVRYS